MSRTIALLPTPAEASRRINTLAEPGEPIEVSLGDATGLVLAEPVVADADLPATDVAACDGFAVRAAEAVMGAWLRVAGVCWSDRGSRADHEVAIEAGEAVQVAAGDPLPVGADAVLRPRDVNADLGPAPGPMRVVEVVRSTEVGRGVAPRGRIVAAGTEIAPAGLRIKPALVGLLASQGAVHPLCHRRVRVAVVAVGDHLVGPGEAPVMHRERNAANLAIVTLIGRANAMAHDLQAVPEAHLPAALDRATSSPVIIVLGPTSRPVRRAFRALGVEWVVGGVAVRPGWRSRFGVIRDDLGRVVHQVFHLPRNPVAATIAFALLVRPMIARLQGEVAGAMNPAFAAWAGEPIPARTGRTARAYPVAIDHDDLGRRCARPVPLRSAGDLVGFAQADAVALIPADSPGVAMGEPVEVFGWD